MDMNSIYISKKNLFFYKVYATISSLIMYLYILVFIVFPYKWKLGFMQPYRWPGVHPWQWPIAGFCFFNQLFLLIISLIVIRRGNCWGLLGLLPIPGIIYDINFFSV